MKITSIIYTIPSFIITYLKYKWKHESPRYLVKEHKIFSAADELYVMAEENNTAVPNGSLIPNIDEENDTYSSTIKLCFKQPKQQKHTTYILINLFGIVITLITGVMHISLLKSTTTNEEHKSVTHMIMNENFTFINLLWSIINLLSIPIVLILYNKCEKFQRHIVLITLYIISGICYMVMAITSQFYVVCILSIPILFTVELGFAIIFQHMIDCFIPMTKSSGFSLMILAISMYSLALINVESLIIDSFVSFKLCLIITSLIESVIAIGDIYGFNDIIERKNGNENLALGDLENGSLINQENITLYEEVDDEGKGGEIKEEEIKINNEVLIEN